MADGSYLMSGFFSIYGDLSLASNTPQVAEEVPFDFVIPVPEPAGLALLTVPCLHWLYIRRPADLREQRSLPRRRHRRPADRRQMPINRSCGQPVTIRMMWPVGGGFVQVAKNASVSASNPAQVRRHQKHRRRRQQRARQPSRGPGRRKNRVPASPTQVSSRSGQAPHRFSRHAAASSTATVPCRCVRAPTKGSADGVVDRCVAWTEPADRPADLAAG